MAVNCVDSALLPRYARGVTRLAATLALMLTLVALSTRAIAQSSITNGPILNVTPFATDPSPCQAGQIWYNTTSSLYKMCPAGTAAVIGSGGGSVTNIATTAPITGGPITSTGTIGFTFHTANAQTSTYQVVAADFASCKTIPVASGTFTITLVASGSQPASGQCIWVLNYGSGVVTLAASGQNLNGTSTSVIVSQGSQASPSAAFVVSDGTNYEVQVFPSSQLPGVDTGSATAFVVAGTGITSLATSGAVACFTPANANSGAGPTVAFNGLTAKTIVKYGGLSLAANDMVTSQPACMIYNGTNFLLLNPQGVVGTGKYALSNSPSFVTAITTPTLLSSTNCGAVGTSASPSVVSCGSAMAGAFSCATNASAATCTINDTAVTANSEVILTEVSSEGTRLSVTCNTVVTTGAIVSAKSAGTSFTVTLPSFVTNPMCFDFIIVN